MAPGLVQLDRVQALISHAYSVAEDILTENKARLVHITQHLIAEETLDKEELIKLFTEPLTSEEGELP